MFVFFLRHASAGTTKANPAQDDEGPLTPEGIEQCRYIGWFLSAIEARVDRILSSPLKRATQTAAFVANEIGYESSLQLEPSLNPTASFEQFQEMLRAHREMDALIVVGHNPTMSRFLSRLVTGGASDKALEMKKGSVARVEINGNKAVLNWLITPKIAEALFLSPPEVQQHNAKE